MLLVRLPKDECRLMIFTKQKKNQNNTLQTTLNTYSAMVINQNDKWQPHGSAGAKVRGSQKPLGHIFQSIRGFLKFHYNRCSSQQHQPDTIFTLSGTPGNMEIFNNNAFDWQYKVEKGSTSYSYRVSWNFFRPSHAEVWGQIGKKISADIQLSHLSGQRENTSDLQECWAFINAAVIAKPATCSYFVVTAFPLKNQRTHNCGGSISWCRIVKK